jgi:gluconolactonase
VEEKFMGPYDPPQVIETEVVATMPAKYAQSGSSPGRPASRYARVQVGVDFYLEGPSFDRAGNLYFTDVPHGRIFRMAPGGEIDLAVEYDGEPNGLKIHKDGRIFIADFRHGIMVLDPTRGTIAPFDDFRPAESFKGLNDLVFASNGDLYFTDQGKTGLHDPSGRVYRYTAGGHLQALIETLPGPNGLVLDPSEKILYVGSRANAIWWQPLYDPRPSSRVGTFATMTGFGTPDGMAVDEAGNVLCVQHSMGVVWVFNRLGLPVYRIETCTTDKLTNVAYGGPERRDLYILDGNGTILVARMPAPGLTMYAHT